MVFNPSFQLGESATSSQSCHDLVTNAKEDADQSSSHSEVIVFKSVPLGLRHDLCGCCCVNNNFVSVYFCHETRAVFLSHFTLARLNQVVSLALSIIDKCLGMGWITNALEELNTLLAFQLLQLSILLDEILFIN